jgi:hypothetical protein
MRIALVGLAIVLAGCACFEGDPAPAVKHRPPARKVAVQPVVMPATRTPAASERAMSVPRGAPCDCPDDLTSDGTRCGWLSAYCRPGGRKPTCEGQSCFKAQ